MNGKQGAIYVATGASHIHDAELSARSLKRIHPDLPIGLFSDTPSAANVFDTQHHIANPHHRSKVDCLALSPFEHTLYLDTDTRILAPVTEGFDLLHRFDFAACHDHQRHPIHCLSARYRPEGVPATFPELNSGVVFYRRNPRTQAFLQLWSAEFTRLQPSRDQPLLRRLLWENPDLALYILPPEYNVRWLKTVLFNGAKESETKIAHMIHFKLLGSRWRRARRRLRALDLPRLKLREVLRLLWMD